MEMIKFRVVFISGLQGKGTTLERAKRETFTLICDFVGPGIWFNGTVPAWQEQGHGFNSQYQKHQNETKQNYSWLYEFAF